MFLSGIATYKGEGDITVNTLFEQADQALFVAKKAGRNCVKVWEESDAAD